MLKKCHALKGTKAHTSDATTVYAAFSHPQPAAWCGERGTPVPPHRATVTTNCACARQAWMPGRVSHSRRVTVQTRNGSEQQRGWVLS